MNYLASSATVNLSLYAMYAALLPAALLDNAPPD